MSYSWAQQGSLLAANEASIARIRASRVSLTVSAVSFPGYDLRNLVSEKARIHLRMAGVAGLEPVTSAVTGQRSNQLSYTPALGAPNIRKSSSEVNCRRARIPKKRFGQQTPRRWGWGTPLKKRTATRIKILYIPNLGLALNLSTAFLLADSVPFRSKRHEIFPVQFDSVSECVGERMDTGSEGAQVFDSFRILSTLRTQTSVNPPRGKNRIIFCNFNVIFRVLEIR